MNFIEQFKHSISKLPGNNPYSAPWQLIEPYRNLIDFIATDGYDDFLVEFDNDISIRESIEKILNDEKLQAYSEFFDFKNEVMKIDEKLKSCFITSAERFHGNRWWQRGILKNGEGNYANDVLEIYNVRL